VPALYYDLASPYAYLAVARAGAVLGAEPDLQPVLAGAIFNWRGHGSWAHTPSREAHVAEVESRARRYGLPPIAWPPGWPADSLQAMRAATWAADRGTGREFARIAFARAFADGADLSDHAVLDDVCERAGLSPAEMREAIATRAIKARLKDATTRAYAAGVAGVPCLRVGDRVFYGDDQLEAAAVAVAA